MREILSVFGLLLGITAIWLLVAAGLDYLAITATSSFLKHMSGFLCVSWGLLFTIGAFALAVDLLETYVTRHTTKRRI